MTGKKDSIGAMIAREAAKDTTMATAYGIKQCRGCICKFRHCRNTKEMSEAEQEARDFLNAVRKEFENGMDPITVSIPVTVDMVETYKNRKSIPAT